MAFTGLLTKLGSNECNEFFSDIKSRNKFETEDNTVLTVLRAVMNEERLATFTADPENKGIMQSLVVENEIRLPDDEKLTAAYYAGEVVRSQRSSSACISISSPTRKRPITSSR
ncbi:hypothetical protein CGS57_02065 [Faecalibacterium prausnitzii]|nr:hypothetical protein CGS57_02065 [Faecalibacterium prausnitzii]